MLYNLGPDDHLAADLARALDAELGVIEQRKFPDGETYLRFETDCVDRHVALLCSLDNPDAKLMRLLLAADTARDLGASTVGLVAPYLAYMRQDARFKLGEGVTSRYVARLLSAHLDWLATVDPHLHRIDSLDEIYEIPSRAVSAAPALADWVRENVLSPLLIGPDGESEQWISVIAARLDAPYLISKKVRAGDRNVSVSIPELKNHTGRCPVLVDDIASSGQTLIEALGHLRHAGFCEIACAIVHPIFADAAYPRLQSAGVAHIVSCNTILHESNGIDISSLLAEACFQFLPSEARPVGNPN